MIMQWFVNREASLYNVIDWDVSKVSVVRNLGAWFDDQLTICSAAFYHLHNVRRIRKYSYPLFF